MNNKQIVAQAIYAAVKEDLTLEQVSQLLENPKTAEHGDVAFPAFALAKVYRKAPQQIASELAEKLIQLLLKNRSRGSILELFMNKEVISEHVLQTVLKEKIIMEINQLAISRRFRLICLHQTLRNQSPWAICVRR